MKLEEVPEEKIEGPKTSSAPSISLPKGGGAIRGMGEKFATNPVTGTGAMSVPIATSPGRSGFGPQLSLAYDSGAGNGPFGFGWSLSLPAITRKTDKGLPRYRNGREQITDSDVFLLSGAEDLVPEFEKDVAGNWVLAAGRYLLDDKARTVHGRGYRVRRYRPRIEGLFARIERWTSEDNPADVHWRSISKDNILSLYGSDPGSRIADPADASRIFSWLISETRDDKGNAVIYCYKPEDGTGVDLSQTNERNRGAADDPRRATNRYLKRILYGNRHSLLDAAGQRPPLPTQGQLDAAGWMFEVVFDYGEHDQVAPRPSDDPAQSNSQSWPARNDPFSTYRACFEVRTCRLCQRVLMFHHIPDLAGGEKGYEGLVRSTDFTYSYEKDPGNARNPIYSFLISVTQTGYQHTGVGGYLSKSPPPVEFEYSQPVVREDVHEVDPASLESLPIGVDGAAYQWTDLHGEGIPGILSEQAGVWYYKRNISPISAQPVEFTPMACVAIKPIAGLSNGQAQFMDLAGDGQPDLVVLDGPMPGLYEHDEAEGWQPFRPLTARLNRDIRNPNLKFIDLDGDGHADVLISEEDAFVWHASLAEEGFGPARRVAQALDEEKGPRLVFADGTQSIYLADLSGDGLTDLVRIRNSEVCYWPNLGYGRFGAKVTMDHAPLFDTPDLFDQKRIRLADIDGSGTTDIIYLHGNGPRLYFNQSGNSWSPPLQMAAFPAVDDLSSVQVTDLLGNGTACLVWSSSLPGDSNRPMRYVALMEEKPHLLKTTRNNLGAETKVRYAPSTKFYLQDKQNGTPWVTRLPFPVHVVEKITITDMWRKTSFATTYRYHHGYFDGAEREFRGFGRVEQIDIEDFGTFAQGNAASPYITDDKALYQPPVKTVTWFHTGAFLDRERILSQFSREYLCVPGFTEHTLPEPDLEGADLSVEEWREALRACKGMLLRQEVYELDVDALGSGTEVPVKLFTTAFHNCDIRRLQPMAVNPHAVLHVTESEAITYHYELDLRLPAPRPDPRVVHTLNLKIDDYGNVLESAAAVYPRLNQYDDPSLNTEQLDFIHDVQNSEHHLALTCNQYTKDISEPDAYRLRLPCQAQSWEVTGIDPAERHFTLKELQAKGLSGGGVQEIGYHILPDRTNPQKRLVECARTLFFDDDLKNALPLGFHSAHGLPYESYKLALTNELLKGLFVGPAKFNTALAALNETTPSSFPLSGYYKGDQLFPDDPITPTPLAQQWWIASGIAGFSGNARQNFYLPDQYADPFGNVTTLVHDDHCHLFLQSSTDALGNTTRVQSFDFRVLAPREMIDINGNHTEVCFDALGMVVASAVKGKQINGRWQGDHLDGFTDALANPDLGVAAAFCSRSALDEAQARAWLGTASARFVYHFGESRAADGSITWNAKMAGACGILRERHVGQLGAGEESSLQVFLECSDGAGNVLMKKAQAEPETPGGPLRWIVNGLTVLNNKGKPVKQYEPAFTSDFGCELPQANGVTPVMYYDAVGRLIRTELPDGSLSRVEFSPWHVAAYDPNDTVLESKWYMDRGSPDPAASMPGEPEARAAFLAAQHANTPALTILDSLGREVIAIAHNKFKDRDGNLVDEQYLTFTKLDAEGKPLWIKDARGNIVMRYTVPSTPVSDPLVAFFPAYDIAGNLLFQHGMDSGDQWMINDAAGKPMVGWQENSSVDESGTMVAENRVFQTAYDALHRPTEQWLAVNGAAAQLIEQYFYGESFSDANDAHIRNLRGQLWRHYEQSGLKTVTEYDFKGNPLDLRRQLASSCKAAVIDWQEGSPTAGLEDETFIQVTQFDALNRMRRLFNWHQGSGSRVAVYEPTYNRRGLLESEELVVRAVKTADTQGYAENSDTQRTTPLQALTYNAKGQREKIRYGNDTITRYQYDPQTFRLKQLRTTRPGYEPPFPSSPTLLSDDQVLQNLYYTYDPAGNVVEIQDDAYEPVFFKNQAVEAKSQFVYDALYRLITATGRENSNLGDNAPRQYEPDPFPTQFPVDSQALRNYRQYYSYDCVGNINEMRHAANGGGWTQNYAYGTDSNRLARTWQGGDTINAVQYLHDQRGNMRNLANVGPQFCMQWDYRDTIQSLNLGGGGRVYYNYDAGKQRTRKVNENQAGVKQWERIYLGGLEIFRKYNGTGLVEEIESLHLIDGDHRLLLVEDVLRTNNDRLNTGPFYRYQYGNHLGSAVLELDDTAAIISYEEYHPYGTSAYRALNSGIKTTAKRYRYTGKERDEESGLYYHGARYYAPWVGRWVSCDPAGMVDGTNLYQYVRCCPIGYNDNKGKQAQKKNEPRSAKPKTDQIRTKVYLFEDSSSVTVTGKDVSFKDKDSHEFLTLSSDTFAKILKKTHGDISKSLKNLKSSSEFREWLVKEYYKGFSGGNPKAANEVGGGKYRYSPSKQLLSGGDTSMQCFYSSYFYMLKSVGVIPPDMSAREFERAYSNLRGEPTIAPIFIKGEHGFPGAEKSPDRSTIVDIFAARANAIASQSEWARFTGMSEKHFKAEDLRHPTLTQKTVKGKTIDTYPDLVDVKKVIERLKSGETIQMGSSAWGHHVLATGTNLIDDPYPGTSGPRGSYEFWQASKIFALWAE